MLRTSHFANPSVAGSGPPAPLQRASGGQLADDRLDRKALGVHTASTSAAQAVRRPPAGRQPALFAPDSVAIFVQAVDVVSDDGHRA
jgi:hypothetical protein